MFSCHELCHNCFELIILHPCFFLSCLCALYIVSFCLGLYNLDMTRASISTLVLSDCFSHSLYWSWWHTSAFSVPNHSPLPLETTDWTKFGHLSYEGSLHRPEKMSWVNRIPYNLWLSTETSCPERTMIYGTFNETINECLSDHIWSRVGSLRSPRKPRLWEGENYKEKAMR